MSHRNEPGRPAQAGTGSGQGDGHPIKSRKHKVVIESVTQEKKKLRIVLSFTARPPPGYTFIPAGHPELTAALKEFARKGNHQIHAVSVNIKTTRHQETHDLSKEVHRIGFHFPTTVVDEVCAHYGISLSASGTLIKEEDRESFRQRRQGRNQRPDDVKDQITINTEARDAIKDLFPNIPDNDLHQIIKTAFQKGQKKVGTATELPLVRRAQLSVVAHVRHMYTKYDSLLRRVQWNEARSMVEGPTLRKLVEWRGDDDNGKEALEDVLREVIVISDDEDSEDESNEVRNTQCTTSVELTLSSVNLQQVEVMPTNYANKAPINERETHDFSEDDAPQGFRYVPQLERRRAIVDKSGIQQRSNRYDAWDRAREQYRANPSLDSENTLHDQGTNAREIVEFERPYRSSVVAPPRPIQAPMQAARRSSPETFRAADGMLYQRMITVQPDASHPTSRRTPPPRQRLPAPASDHPKSQHVVHDDRVESRLRTDPLYDRDILVLPSIEGQEHPRTSQHNPFSRPNSLHMPVNPLKELPRPQVRREDPSRESNIIDLTSADDHRDAKRRRIENPFSDAVVPRRYEHIEPLAPTERRYVSMMSSHPDRPLASRQYPHADSVEQEGLSKTTHTGYGLEPVYPMRTQPPVPLFHDVPATRPFEVLRHADEVHQSPSDRSNNAVAPRLRSLPSAQSHNDGALRRTSFVTSNQAERLSVHHDRVQTAIPLEVIPLPREVPGRRARYASGEIASSRRQPIIEPEPIRSVGALNGSGDSARSLSYAQPFRYRELEAMPREIVEYVQPDGTTREYFSAVRSVPTFRRMPIEIDDRERRRQTQEHMLSPEEISGSTTSTTYRRFEQPPPTTYVRN